jgi:hypothetical protein
MHQESAHHIRTEIKTARPELAMGEHKFARFGNSIAYCSSASAL